MTSHVRCYIPKHEFKTRCNKKIFLIIFAQNHTVAYAVIQTSTYSMILGENMAIYP